MTVDTKPNFSLIFVHKFCKHVHLWRVKEVVNAVYKSRMMRLLYEPQIVVWAMSLHGTLKSCIIFVYCLWPLEVHKNPNLCPNSSGDWYHWVVELSILYATVLELNIYWKLLSFKTWSYPLKQRYYYCISLKPEVALYTLAETVDLQGYCFLFLFVILSLLL